MTCSLKHSTSTGKTFLGQRLLDQSQVRGARHGRDCIRLQRLHRPVQRSPFGGTLLRYLSDAYRVLARTVPPEKRNEELDDIIAWLRVLVLH